MENRKNKTAIIYCRVSSIKQAQEGDSLEIQEGEGRRIALEKNVNVHPTHGVWKDAFSGRSDSRPKFDEMMIFVRTHRSEVDYVIVKGIDRLTRGGSDSYSLIKKELKKYGVEIMDSQGIVQPSMNTLAHLDLQYPWSTYSPSETSEKVAADNSKEEVRRMLSRLIGSEVLLVRSGYHIGQPAEGFANKRIYVKSKKRMIQIPDDKKAHFFIKMFEMRASGLHTDEEIVDKINNLGFKSKTHNFWNQEHTEVIAIKGNKPLTVKRLQEVIQKPVYCGVICNKFTKRLPVKAQYEGLVSIKTFNMANKGKVFIKENDDASLSILYNHCPEKLINIKSKYNPLFPFKNVVRCPQCGKTLSGSASTGKSGGKFPSYHCARNHGRFSARKADLDNHMERIVNSLKADSRVLAALRVALKDIYKERSKEMEEYKDAVRDNLEGLRHRQDEILGAIQKTSSDLVREKLESQFEELQKQIETTEQTVPEETINEYDIDSFIEAALYLMEHRQELLLNTKNMHEMEVLYGLVFDELPTYQDLINGTLKLSLIFENQKELAFANSLSVGAQGFEPWTPSV